MSSATIRGLEVFCTVIQAGGFTAAARQIGLSQPAVSQQMAKLEDSLGLTLFVREHGRTRPTEAALTLYEEATIAFDGLDRVTALARDIRSLDRGVIRVAAPHSLSASYLPRALKTLVEGHPNLRISVLLGTYERIIALVAAREVDIGIAKLPIMAVGVETIPIMTSPLVGVVAETHPLAKKPGLSLKEVAREPLIMLGRGRPWRDQIDARFREMRLAALVSVETQSVESACGFAAQGFGLAIVPEWLFTGLKLPGLVGLPLDIGIEHEFAVAFPSRTRRSMLAHDFAKACISAATAPSG
ncbi:LysR family transcriptional regulator [Oceanicola sp. 502str15]|uniref:LysR family transcriptional regulator n=1 Tax=Oceanicola sp. 502str15 TaxID=2696061 RepID=UPI0020964A5C|nr:LysR family transcriptional regulator [Oceanicola sp. 502str15]MCO6382689.1 LysR family transcriptional regulator [Oceanicola sp. 502str15]